MMESINFNDFTQKERHDIITAFLIKMRQADSLASAQNFFEYYLKRFYKVPPILLNDIAYCQRAMKTHMSVYQQIVKVFAQQKDADMITKNRYLEELEEMLHELNAECQFLLLRLQDDIDEFCLAFTKQQLQPNQQMLQSVVSSALVPLICSAHNLMKPHHVLERPTEQELLQKYFTKGSGEQQREMSYSRSLLRAKQPSGKEMNCSKNPVRDTKALNATQNESEPPLATVQAVESSRLNLQAALKRARSKQLRASEVSGGENSPSANTASMAPPDKCKELFMYGFGLCTHTEHKRLSLARTMVKNP
ncbi:uncharacterized protein LOC115623186 isoform X1 [Scaptodrosophila lebanonensis]|uniref:Uncharacterized protein LOC115623186 isoform X1 n=1 Tax=Drosophila lebanonensis TaxID=7225 RepID=A0A6J2TDS0_DROLE|nr:uncharacterized protein LOC115623186 isoform X1 [Scaptodrosophila lebanonensis]